MADRAAAHLAARLRTAMKDQALRGREVADRIERLTGDRPSEVWVSRRTNPDGVKFVPLLKVSDDMFVIAAALDLDPMDLIEDAVRLAVATHAAITGDRS